MKNSLIAAVASLIALLAAAVPAAAHDKLGANLNFIGDFRRNHEFVDVVKQSRRFLKIGQFDDSLQANLAPIGPDGWPTTDFRVFAMAAQQNTLNLAGTYRIVFTGTATLSTTGGGEGTITNKVHDAGTNTTTADLNFPAGAENLMVDFTATGGVVKNVRILRPGYPIAATPLLHAPWKTHTERFRILRFLDWTRTNGNRDTAWADRTTPEKLRTEAYIAQWETVIDAANLMNRDPWINVPVQANDEYVTNLATLIRNRLNPNLNVYVEYGNELWNFGIRDVDLDNFHGAVFNGATVNRDLAAASPLNSPLRTAFPSEGVPDDTTRGFRRVALRLLEISNIFKAVWPAGSINTRVRPVLAGQMANSFIVTEGLRFIDEIMVVKPETVFYAMSGAPYIFPAAIPDGNADETPGMTVQQIIDGLAAGVANAPSDSNAYQYLTHAGLGAWYGLKVVAYEAGFDNFGTQNIPNKRLANLDPQIRTICRNMIDQWHSFGFEHILWFNGGADSYNTQFGMWPVVEDIAVPATPKNQCMDDVLAAGLPAVTVGTPITSPVAAGNYRGSANTSGPVTGNDAPFGFPGFVEYLLRVDAEGIYNIVFTGSAAPSERFLVRLNNATVATNVSLPSSPGNAAPISVTLRAGLNALRLQRQPSTGTSWSVTSFAFTLVSAGPVNDLALAQTAPGSVGAGKDVIFTLTATNNGASAATGVEIDYGVPPGSTFIWAQPGCNHVGGVVTCTASSLGAGASSITRIVVRPAAVGPITANAILSANGSDPNAANNSASTNVSVGSTPAGAPIQRYRLYSDVTKEHHFTTDFNEYTVLGSLTGTWVQEGTVGKLLDNPGTFNGVQSVPYYRLYDNGTQWHHWTTDANEYYTLGFVFAGWNMEGVDGYILPTQAVGTIELYRLNYPALGSLHHWTIDANEYNTLIASFGWVGEPGAGFVVQ